MTEFGFPQAIVAVVDLILAIQIDDQTQVGLSSTSTTIWRTWSMASRHATRSALQPLCELLGFAFLGED
jgi:hypothetical protein